MKLSAVVITYNEEKNIEACLESLNFCDEIVVVDSGSRDATVSLAKKFTQAVLERGFDNFSAQKNTGVDAASHPWILSLDADERISTGLREEILSVIQTPLAEAFAIPRKNYIFGTHLRYGLNKGDAPLRLFLKKSGRFEGIIHEKWVSQGRTLLLKNEIVHNATPTLCDYLRKLDHYTHLEAKLLNDRGEKFSFLTLLLKPPARFIQRYCLHLGALDGKEGFMYSVLSGFYEFVRYLKLWELQKRDKDGILEK